MTAEVKVAKKIRNELKTFNIECKVSTDSGRHQIWVTVYDQCPYTIETIEKTLMKYQHSGSWKDGIEYSIDIVNELSPRILEMAFQFVKESGVLDHIENLPSSYESLEKKMGKVIIMGKWGTSFIWSFCNGEASIYENLTHEFWVDKALPELNKEVA